MTPDNIAQVIECFDGHWRATEGWSTKTTMCRDGKENGGHESTLKLCEEPKQIINGKWICSLEKTENNL